jgi:uncharacterized protein YwbE
MKLHTNLTDVQVSNALYRAQQKGLITRDVHFAVFTPGRSLTHPHGFEIQLGTYNQDSLPAGYTDQNGRKLRVRRIRGSNGGSAKWAATWHEWGWLIAEIFAADPGARWGSDPARSARPQYALGYASAADFHAKTNGSFLPPLPDADD